MRHRECDRLLPGLVERPPHRVQEEVAGQVALLLRPVPEPGQQPPARRVRRQHPVVAAHHVGGQRPYRFQHAQHGVTDGVVRAGRQFGDPPGGQLREFVQPFVGVPAQAQGPAEGVHDGGRGVGLPAAFESDVVVHAHPGDRGEFLAAQSRGAAQARTGREAHVLRTHLRPACLQVPAEFGPARVGCCSHSVNCVSSARGLGDRVRARNAAPRYGAVCRADPRGRTVGAKRAARPPGPRGCTTPDRGPGAPVAARPPDRPDGHRRPRPTGPGGHHARHPFRPADRRPRVRAREPGAEAASAGAGPTSHAVRPDRCHGRAGGCRAGRLAPRVHRDHHRCVGGEHRAARDPRVAQRRDGRAPVGGGRVHPDVRRADALRRRHRRPGGCPSRLRLGRGPVHPGVPRLRAGARHRCAGRGAGGAGRCRRGRDAGLVGAGPADP
ncbi:hypothetical protein SGPA1_21692 [Streptomyces misionensis JCM 4497]